MDTEQLEEAIYDVLDFCILPYSTKVVNMIIETACVESCCGKYIKQIKGPACGIFQMEPKTARDIYTNYIVYRPEYKHYYDKLYNNYLSLEQNLMYNLAFQIFMCRIFYLRIKDPIPDTKDKRAEYWKQYYNTKLGKGSVSDYLAKVLKYDTRKFI